MALGGIRTANEGIRIGIQMTRARQTPKTDFGTLFGEPSYPAGDLGLLAIAEMYLEADVSSEEILTLMSALPRASNSAETDPEEEIDRLLYVVAELQKMVQQERKRIQKLTQVLEECRTENLRLKGAKERTDI